MPHTEAGQRSLHSLAYSAAERGLLVCDSITDAARTSCDLWRPGEAAWRPGHSSPHREDTLRCGDAGYNLFLSLFDGIRYYLHFIPS